MLIKAESSHKMLVIISILTIQRSLLLPSISQWGITVMPMMENLLVVQVQAITGLQFPLIKMVLKLIPYYSIKIR